MYGGDQGAGGGAQGGYQDYAAAGYADYGMF
jgi:hypothetical protein